MRINNRDKQVLSGLYMRTCPLKINRGNVSKSPDNAGCISCEKIQP